MGFGLLTYVVGSFYIINTIFHVSNNFTSYLFNNKIVKLPMYKFHKINEVIYSSIHCLLVSILSFLCFEKQTIDYNNYFNFTLENKIKDNDLILFTLSLSFSYFVVDLFRCLYYKKYLFIIHHLSASFLLGHHIYMIKNKLNYGVYAIHTLFLLESNNIFLNVGFLLKEFKYHYSITCISWIVHLIFFIIFRLIQFPKVFFVYVLNDFDFTNLIIQLPNLIIIYIGSLYWSWRQIAGIQKYLKENSVI
tara:strand:- start:2470 stop:3213 length:744 start_codon:yes stop_codon:yes gene_type:complete